MYLCSYIGTQKEATTVAYFDLLSERLNTLAEDDMLHE